MIKFLQIVISLFVSFFGSYLIIEFIDYIGTGDVPDIFYRIFPILGLIFHALDIIKSKDSPNESYTYFLAEKIDASFKKINEKRPSQASSKQVGSTNPKIITYNEPLDELSLVQLNTLKQSQSSFHRLNELIQFDIYHTQLIQWSPTGKYKYFDSKGVEKWESEGEFILESVGLNTHFYFCLDGIYIDEQAVKMEVIHQPKSREEKYSFRGTHITLDNAIRNYTKWRDMISEYRALIGDLTDNISFFDQASSSPYLSDSEAEKMTVFITRLNKQLEARKTPENSANIELNQQEYERIKQQLKKEKKSTIQKWMQKAFKQTVNILGDVAKKLIIEILKEALKPHLLGP